MRLWSIHPIYLDTKGLAALWREGLLARKVIDGKTKGYKHHPQLLRFQKTAESLKAIDYYLETVVMEGKKRGYSFDFAKIVRGRKVKKIIVTDGQVIHETLHLKSKLLIRDLQRLKRLTTDEKNKKIKIHPLFKLTEGRVEQWEKVTDNLGKFPYDLDFKKVDFRKNPELYKIGIGEQGVLMVEPYKSEILPHWRFRTPEIAEKSANKIYQLFLAYKTQKDFVGMDMARKFLQMGYTRSRRYANHSSGKKYDKQGKILPQEKDWAHNKKAQSARIFYRYYLQAREDAAYINLKKKFAKQ